MESFSRTAYWSISPSWPARTCYFLIIALASSHSSLDSRTNSSTIISWLQLERSGFFPFLFRVLVQPLTNPLDMVMIRTRSRVIYRCLFSWLIILTNLPSSRSEQSLLMNMIMKRNILPTTLASTPPPSLQSSQMLKTREEREMFNLWYFWLTYFIRFPDKHWNDKVGVVRFSPQIRKVNVYSGLSQGWGFPCFCGDSGYCFTIVTHSGASLEYLSQPLSLSNPPESH